MVRRALLALPITLAACTQDLPPPPRPCPETPAAPPPAAFRPADVAPPATMEGTVTRIDARDQIPLTGPRADAKVGDWKIESPGSAAAVTAEGRIVDFAGKGARDELVALDPAVFFGFESVHFETDRVEPVEGGRALHIVKRVLEKPLLLHVYITFSGERLRIESALVAAAPLKTPVAVTLGERAYWGNVPTWAEGQGYVTRGGTFRTDFIAREAYGTAYALRAEGGRLLTRFDAPDSGFFEPATTGEAPEIVPPDRPTSRRVILLAHAAGSSGRAVAALDLPAAQHVAPPAGLPPEARVDVARCGAGTRSGTLYARYHAGEGDIALPAGCFQMRLLAPGHTAGPWFSPSAAAGRALTPSGTLRFAVTDKTTGKPIPARVMARGIKGSADPDWGTDADRGASLNVVYADTGAGERPVPPGKYHVTIDRGFEYTAFEKDIDVAAGKIAGVRATLERVVDTRGYIAADLHLHAMPSPDAPQPLVDRVRALAATGVEVGVATDHNKVTDYKPAIAEIGMAPYLASIVGDEITTRDPSWGHFNAFPLAAGSDPLPYRGQTPATLFAAARAAGPGVLLQLNHPRMGGIGYFDLVRLDQDDIAGWSKRVGVADLGFDAIEIFNGDHYARIDKVEAVMRDWYALLEAGHRFTATGNSDSHRLTFHEPGVPRNLVAVPDDDPAHFDEKAFVEAVRKGRVVVSSGPFIRMEANGKGLGETVPAGAVTVSISVEAPPWVDVDRVEIIRRGETAAAFKVPPAKGAHRFDVRTELTLRKGDFIIAVARGSRPMAYLHRPGAKPFAFTNPIWVQ